MRETMNMNASSMVNSERKGNRNTKILISKIPNSVPWEETVRVIGSCGTLTSVEHGDFESEDEYSAIATFETEDEAQKALTQIDGQALEGSELKVEFMMEQQSRQSRGGGTRNNRNSFRSPTYSGSGSSPLRPTDFPLRDMVGAIIGRSGGTIRQITQQSHARVDVHRKENAGALEKVITIYGNPENCSHACQKILEVMQQEANSTNRGEIPLKILAHNNLIGRIIGKSGNTIKRIMEQTDTKITVSRIITIKGSSENICKAEAMISGKLRQSYESDLQAIAPQALMFPGLHPMAMMSTLGAPGYSLPPPPPPPQRGPSGGYGLYNAPPSYANVPPLMYASGGGGSPGVAASGSAFTAGLQAVQGDLTKETVFVYIPNTAVGAIIGTGGATIREMISSSGASIKVAQPGRDEPQFAGSSVDRSADKTERKVTIVGNPEGQWKAQFMIFRKVGYEGFQGPQGPHEATLRVEIMVPSNQVGRIIGKGGTVVREMQRNTRALIKLPEENTSTTTPELEETPVHIIGDFLSTQAAQRQIRALVSRINVPSGTKRESSKKPEATHTNHTQPQDQQQQSQGPSQSPDMKP